MGDSGVNTCLIDGVKNGGVIINGKPLIYASSQDFYNDFENLHTIFHDGIKSIKSLELKMNPNCKVKIEVFCNVI